METSFGRGAQARTRCELTLQRRASAAVSGRQMVLVPIERNGSTRSLCPTVSDGCWQVADLDRRWHFFEMARRWSRAVLHEQRVQREADGRRGQIEWHDARSECAEGPVRFRLRQSSERRRQLPSLRGDARRSALPGSAPGIKRQQRLFALADRGRDELASRNQVAAVRARLRWQRGIPKPTQASILLITNHKRPTWALP